MKSIEQYTNEQLSKYMAGGQPGSQVDQIARAEYLRRQTEFIQRQTKAAEDMSIYTKRYTFYMLWSVMFLSISAIATFVVAAFSIFKSFM